MPEAESNDENHVLDAMGKVASEIRTELGESLASVQKYDVRPENVTTPSSTRCNPTVWPCRSDTIVGPRPAVSTRDRTRPQFCHGLRSVRRNLRGSGRNRCGEPKASAKHIRCATASQSERFYIASHYDEMVTGDLDAALADYRLLGTIYPRDSAPFGGLATNYYYRGDFERLLEAVRKGAALATPSNKPSQPEINEIWSLILLNRLDEAKAMSLGAQTNHVDDPMFHLTLYVIDFLRNDGPGMEHEVEVLTNNPTWGHAVLQYQMSTAAYYGRFARAGISPDEL